jgi:hypothetical protein
MGGLRRICGAALAATLVAMTLALAAEPAGASPSGVVISQVYGGGSSVGALYDADYVELFNAGSAPVALIGWTIGYTSATGTNISPTPLVGVIQPGGYFLVRQAASSTGGAPLPAADAIGTTTMSATAGRVVLAGPGQVVEDLVGYGPGSAPSEGLPTASLSVTTAALRNGGGCTDTGSNVDDFTVAAPAPRNSATAAAPCSAAPPESTTTTTPTTTAPPTTTTTVPPAGGLQVAFDFGTVEVGLTSAPLTETIPLSTTVDAVRAVLLDAAAQSSPPPEVAGLISTAQWRQVLADTVNGLPGPALLAVRVNGYSVDPAGEFQLDGCVGADGAATPSCDMTGTFTPADIGARQAAVLADLTVTQFPAAELQSALSSALAANGLGLLAPFTGVMLGVIQPLVEQTVVDSLNPVASLGGTGVPAAVVAEFPVGWAAPAAIAGGTGLVLLIRRRRSTTAR